MKRADFISEVLNVTGLQTNFEIGDVIYCDKSQSKNPKNQNKYFLRLKFYNSSKQVYKHFDQYKIAIEKLLRGFGDNESYVVLRKTCLYRYISDPKHYYFIEIIFPNGKVWDKAIDYKKEERIKAFKIYFDININCNGIYKTVKATLTVPGRTEKEAKEKFLKDASFKTSINEIEIVK